MFNWIKNLFCKKEPELYEVVMVVTGSIKEGRTKGGKFAKGNKVWSKAVRGKNGRFTK